MKFLALEKAESADVILYICELEKNKLFYKDYRANIFKLINSLILPDVSSLESLGFSCLSRWYHSDPVDTDQLSTWLPYISYNCSHNAHDWLRLVIVWHLRIKLQKIRCSPIKKKANANSKYQTQFPHSILSTAIRLIILVITT